MKRRNFVKSIGGFLGLLVIPFIFAKPQYKSYPPTLESHYGIDAEKELTKMMSEELRYEIDMEALKKYNRSINKYFYSNVKIVGEK